MLSQTLKRRAENVKRYTSHKCILFGEVYFIKCYMVTFNGFIIIFKSINKILEFSMLISNTINIDRCSPYKQKLFKVLNFYECNRCWDQRLKTRALKEASRITTNKYIDNQEDYKRPLKKKVNKTWITKTHQIKMGENFQERIRLMRRTRSGIKFTQNHYTRGFWRSDYFLKGKRKFHVFINP